MSTKDFLLRILLSDCLLIDLDSIASVLSVLGLAIAKTVQLGGACMTCSIPWCMSPCHRCNASLLSFCTVLYVVNVGRD